MFDKNIVLTTASVAHGPCCDTTLSTSRGRFRILSFCALLFSEKNATDKIFLSRHGSFLSSSSSSSENINYFYLSIIIHRYIRELYLRFFLSLSKMFDDDIMIYDH